MPTQRVLVFRPKTIVPPEAAGIASRLFALNAEGERRAADLRTLETQLGMAWEGNARNRFLAAFDSQPGGSAADAGFIAQKAGEIASIRVTVWEAVWETVEVPG
jgi:hypothetical protein